MSDKSGYIKICEANMTIPVFMQPWWLDAACGAWDAVVYKKGDHVAGVWAYRVEKKLGVGIIRNPLLTPYLGPVVLYPAGLKESNFDHYEHEVVTNLMEQLPRTEVWHLALQPGMKQVGIFKNNGLQPHVQQTFLLDLHPDEEALLANMKDTTRRNIRSSEKEITIADSPRELRELFKFQKDTLTNKGKAAVFTFKYLQQMMDACVANNSAALWVAKTGDKIQAIVWQVWDEQCSYYLMGGQSQESNSYKAMSALLWHAVKEAKKRGNTTFDLEGSMDAGVERFFRSFGGQRALYLVLQKNESVIWKLKKMVFR
jgi:GNAT acetyltransferase-like protein